MPEPILTVKNITKTYPGVVALNNVSMTFEKGEVHALLGENGAGKSTLIKVISGAIEPDHGQITFDGKEYKKMTPALARECRVAVIYQEFSLVESLSVAQNVFLGKKSGALVNYGNLKKQAAQIFAEMNVKIDPSAQVMKLSPAQRQLVEIAKAISRNARLLIMDEPSAPLSASEVETMFTIIGQLKSKGVTIIYISHRIEELFRISDRVTVMRDGRYIDTLVTKQTNRKELINLMVGREMKEYYPKRTGTPGEIVLEVKSLSGLGDQDISFSIRKGEILGVAGLVGSGRTELASIIYGVSPKESGETWIEGQKREIHSPDQAIEYGIGLIPEDRKHHGCILNASVHFNISLSTFNKNARFLVVNSQAQKKTAAYYVDKLNIKTPSMEQRVQNLSGGNQQKVILAKTLAANTNILIFDEPTRGIDVGSKQEIYNLMIELVNQGKTILMISSEMEELLGMADRLIVLCEGRFMGEVPKEKFDQRTVIELAPVIIEIEEETMKEFNLRGLQKYAVMFILIILMALFSFSSPYFFTVRNLTNILTQNTYFIILAIGLSFVMIGGGIDLSVGWQMSLVGVVMAMCMTLYQLPVWLSILIGIGLGTFLGFFNGVIVANIRVFPLIVTIATSTVFQGISYIVSHAQTYRQYPDQFLFIAKGKALGMPFDVLLTIVIVLIATFIYAKTSYGWNVLAMGGNEEASRLAGIKTKATKISVYTLCGFFTAIATMVMISKSNTTNSSFGPGSEFTALTAAIVGGISFMGGEGNMLGLVTGVLILAVLGNGMQLAGWGTYAQYIVKGIILLGAVTFDEFQKTARITKRSKVNSEPANPEKKPA